MRSASRSRAVAAVAQGFITEMSPHLPLFDREILFRLIPRNVIPREELAVLSEQYDRQYSAKQGGVARHVFASMFKIGLHPETAELVQYFRHPGARCWTATTSCRTPSTF